MMNKLKTDIMPNSSEILILAQAGQIKSEIIFSQSPYIGDKYKEISIYRALLSVDKPESAGLAWYNLGVLLFNTKQYIFCEQAFISSLECNDDYSSNLTRKAFEQIDFNTLNADSMFLRSAFRDIREGSATDQGCLTLIR